MKKLCQIVGTVHSIDMVAGKTHVGLVRKQLQDNQREITQAGVTRKRWARLTGSRRLTLREKRDEYLGR